MANQRTEDIIDPTDSTAELQTMLRRRSYIDQTIPRVTSDGIFGRETEEAVRAFQKSAGLPETGQPDLETWNALVRAVNDDLSYHTAGAPIYPVSDTAILSEPITESELIRMLQLLLRTVSPVCGFRHPIEISGIYDEVTAAAVAVVQQVCGLHPTGKMDPASWSSLAQLYNHEVEKRQAELKKQNGDRFSEP